MFKSYIWLPFVDEKAKVNASYYVTKLLPNLIKDCRHLLSDNFIFQPLWRNCSHSSSCPRLDQEEMPWFHWNKTKRMANEFVRSQSIGLSWQLTFITKTFELLTKKLCKVWFVISEHSRRVCMFTWKSELQSLNCCIYWTTPVILIKLTTFPPQGREPSPLRNGLGVTVAAACL